MTDSTIKSLVEWARKKWSISHPAPSPNLKPSWVRSMVDKCSIKVSPLSNRSSRWYSRKTAKLNLLNSFNPSLTSPTSAMALSIIAQPTSSYKTLMSEQTMTIQWRLCSISNTGLFRKKFIQTPLNYYLSNHSKINKQKIMRLCVY